MKEKWIVETKRADFGALAAKFGISPVLARIIRNRDVTEEEGFRLFLHGTLEDLPDARLLKDMDKALAILQEKIRKKARVRVLGDYDIDGVCSTYILVSAFQRLGLDCDADIPDRITDGYGMNPRMIRDAIAAGVDTIVTCDNGISAKEACRLAKEAGLTIIVTDHHEVPKDEDGQEILPEADAVIDPKQKACQYPFKEICGAEVAWKLVGELYRLEGIGKQEWLSFIEFAALATVGDVMPLKEENRIIVREGLKAMANTKNIGLSCLIEATGLKPDHLNTYHLGFVIGPCLNAGGRLQNAKIALALFFTDSRPEAMDLAQYLRDLNEQRKVMTEDGLKAAIDTIEKEGLDQDDVLVVWLPECHESLAGIIAGRLRERYNHPAFVLTGTEEMVKGSGRSIPAYSMFDELCRVSGCLEKFGGHPMAAGLSLKKDNIEAFRSQLNTFSTLKPDDFCPEVRIDVPMPIDYITEDLIGQFAMLEPCGTGNPRPVFAESHFRILRAAIIGRNRNVLKMTVVNPKGCRMEAVYFGDIPAFQAFVEKEYGRMEVENMFRGRENSVDLAFTYYPEINEYNGRRSLQIIISHYCRIKNT